MPKNQASNHPSDPGQPRGNARALLLWIVASGGGGFLGAALAVGLFPKAGWGQNPTGQFGWHLLGFALTVGLPFALAQSLALGHLLRGRGGAVVRLLWLPLTTAGIAGMIMPLWWYDAGMLMWFPWLVARAMLPGILFMAIAQGLVMQNVLGIGLSWTLWTVGGAVGGAVAGLIAPAFLVGLLFMVASFPIEIADSIPIEPLWALGFGATLGLAQGLLLARHLGEGGGDA